MFHVPYCSVMWNIEDPSPTSSSIRLLIKNLEVIRAINGPLKWLKSVNDAPSLEPPGGHAVGAVAAGDDHSKVGHRVVELRDVPAHLTQHIYIYLPISIYLLCWVWWMHCQYTSSSNLGSTVQLILTYCHWRLMYYHISLPYAHMWGHVPDCPSLSFSEKAPQGKLRILSRLTAMLLLPRSLPRTSPGWRWCRPSSRHCAGRTRRGPRGTSGRGGE